MKTIIVEITIANGKITLPPEYKFEGEVKIVIAEKESQEFGEDSQSFHIKTLNAQ